MTGISIHLILIVVSHSDSDDIQPLFRMKNSNLISIVIPYGIYTREFDNVVANAQTSDRCAVEIIVVTTPDLAIGLRSRLTEEIKLIVSESIGRGHFCYEGARISKGEIIMFLHADTILPKDWHNSVTGLMADESCAGGGFSVKFNGKGFYLRNIHRLYNPFASVTGEFWGDRAIFLRNRILQPHLEKLRVPMMEDVILSKIIRKSGKIVMLPDMVITGADHFLKKGQFTHTFQIIWYRLLYSFGTSAEQIFGWYYRGH